MESLIMFRRGKVIGPQRGSHDSRLNECGECRLILRFWIESGQTLSLSGSEKPLVGGDQNQVIAVGTPTSGDGQRRSEHDSIA